jgi:4-hydroxybenzoyl-CoA thioesterase
MTQPRNTPPTMSEPDQESDESPRHDSSLVNTLPFVIQWGDCDAAGIVFYPNYFRLFDAGTHALFKRAGLGWEAFFEQYRIVGVPLVNVTCRFIRPATFGDSVEIESAIAKWGRSSFDVRHRISRAGTLIVEGTETRVWGARDPSRGNSLSALPIPDEVKRRFALG